MFPKNWDMMKYHSDNMEKSKSVISELYRAAKKHDADILKHFNDDELSDTNYFLYAINEDIMSNVITIILDLTLDNLESPGVDNSCRTIIEAITLLSIYNKGLISKLQLKIYRYSYALVEIDNLRSIIKKYKLPIDKIVQRDKNIALNLFAQHFDMSRDELGKMIYNQDPNKRFFCSDPLAFLLKKPCDHITFEKIIKQYHPFGESAAKVYTLFSIFNHPRCEENVELETNFQDARKSFVYSVLDTVVEYFKVNKLFIEDETITDATEDLFGDQYKENTATSLRAIEGIFGLLIKELSFYPDDSIDGQSYFFLGKLKSIAKSLVFYMHRGHREQVISIFRPFAELSCVINKINTFDITNFYTIRKTFVYSSRLQLVNLIDQITNKRTEMDKTGLQEVYEDYYKQKYNLDSFVKFEYNIIHNSLYFLDKSKKNYRSIVLDGAKVVFNNNDNQEEFMTLYKMSLDLSHASGYSFNSSITIITDFAYRSQIMFWKYLYDYALLAENAKRENGNNADVSKPLKAIKIMIDGLQKEYLDTIETKM